MNSKNYCPRCFESSRETCCPSCGWEFGKTYNRFKKSSKLDVNNELVITPTGLLCSGISMTKYSVVFGIDDDPSDKGIFPFCFTNFLGNVCPGDYKLNY